MIDWHRLVRLQERTVEHRQLSRCCDEDLLEACLGKAYLDGVGANDYKLGFCTHSCRPQDYRPQRRSENIHFARIRYGRRRYTG